jgi:release factor glutamine methyltransferase
LNAGAAVAGAGIDAREARLLLAGVSGFSEAILIAFPDRSLPEPVREKFQILVERRKRGEPVAYLLGRREFYGLDLVVSPAVLIPRPETELLVDLALRREPSTVLELGAGSGAISLAIKRHRPLARVVAVESDPAALAIARGNAVKLGLDIDFRPGSWYAPVAGERFEAVVSNPPYVAEGDPHLEELKYEPRAALVAGRDGLDAIREIAAGAPAHLAPGGWLLLEHGLGQDGAVRELLSAAGLVEIATWPDLAGIARATGGRVKS